MEWIRWIFNFLYERLLNYSNINWLEAEYANPYMSLTLAGILILLTVAILLLRRNRFRVAHEGYNRINQKGDGILRRILRFFPKVFLMISIVFMLLAAAKPYYVYTEVIETELTEFLERYEVIDVSGSMNDRFGRSGGRYYNSPTGGDAITKGQLAREHHMNFVRMREGQGDRACLWAFSNNPYILQDCIRDDKAYLFQVWMAPHVFTASSYPQSYRNDDIRRWYLRGEGGTQINPLLRSLIRYIQDEGDPNVLSRAVIIFTDAQVFGDYEEEIRILRQEMDVSIYIILINDRINQSAQRFINTVEDYGGRTFNVGEEEQLEEALETIDELERKEVEIYEEVGRDDLSSQAAHIGLTFLFLALVSYMVINPLIGTVE